MASKHRGKGLNTDRNFKFVPFFRILDGITLGI